jgi:hypothetical protein
MRAHLPHRQAQIVGGYAVIFHAQPRFTKDSSFLQNTLSISGTHPAPCRSWNRLSFFLLSNLEFHSSVREGKGVPSLSAR